MNALKPLVTALMALNWLAAPIAIVWLVILGEWWVIGVAFASLFSHFLLGLALIPGLALVAPAVAAGESRPRLALFLGALPLLYTAALVTVWCIGVLILLLRRADASSLIPICLLAYSIGTAPWGCGAPHFWSSLDRKITMSGRGFPPSRRPRIRSGCGGRVSRADVGCCSRPARLRSSAAPPSPSQTSGR